MYITRNRIQKLDCRRTWEIIPCLCWTLPDRLYAPNNGCNACLCSLFSCHISSAFYVSIYFSRHFSSLQSFSLGRSDFRLEFRMEVETGAAASILYYTDYERYFKYLAVRPSGNIIPLLCWCTAGHFRTDCMHRTMAAIPIYARYFPVIFLALFISTPILVDFSRFYKVSHLQEAT